MNHIVIFMNRADMVCKASTALALFVASFKVARYFDVRHG